MNNRVKFTKMLCELLKRMIEDGENPVVDYVLRSKEEQRRLFERGLSKCDGEKIKSKHQLGCAADIYLCDEKGNIRFEWDRKKAEKYHKIWEEMGGKKMIEWDLPHFEI